jgi:hypothetical protein
LSPIAHLGIFHKVYVSPSLHADSFLYDFEKERIFYEYDLSSIDKAMGAFDFTHNGEYILFSNGTKDKLALVKAHWDYVSVEEQPEKTSGNTIYPNPATGIATIKYEQKYNTETSIDVLDIQGNILKSIYNGFMKSGTQTIVFSVSDIPTGTYLVSIRNKYNSLSFKLIINH